MARWTVGALKLLLEHLPDERLVVTPGPDHSYRPATVYRATAILGVDGDLFEGPSTDGAEAEVDVLVVL